MHLKHSLCLVAFRLSKFFLESLGLKAMKPLIKNIMDGKNRLSFTRTNKQTAFTATKQKVGGI